MERGKFIVFEGIDGSGKSTQIKLLSKHLRERGISCYLTCEPTDSPFGALVHQCMTGRVETDERTIALLFAADRLDHINNTKNGILKMIEDGTTVICDRYYLSSYAYNGAYTPLDWVVEANRLSAETLRPDVNIFIDITPEASLERLKKRGVAERYEKLESLRAVRDKYFEIFERFKGVERVEIVKSREKISDTELEIRKIADKLYD